MFPGTPTYLDPNLDQNEKQISIQGLGTTEQSMPTIVQVQVRASLQEQLKWLEENGVRDWKLVAKHIYTPEAHS